MNIQEVAEKTGLSAHTLRYYERAELIPPVDRADNGHRHYDEEDLAWLDFVKCLRETAMPIAEIRRYMDLALQGDHTNDERLQLLAEHRVLVKQQLAELQKNLAALDDKIAYYESLRS